MGFDWNLRYEAFGKIIEQVSTASNVLATLANKNSFVTKNVTSSDSTVITAVASPRLTMCNIPSM